MSRRSYPMITLGDLYNLDLDNLILQNYNYDDRIITLNEFTNHGIVNRDEYNLLKYILIDSLYDKKTNQLDVSIKDLQEYITLKDQIKMRIKEKLDETPEQRAQKQREESERISEEDKRAAAAKAAAKKIADEKAAKKEERNQYKFARPGQQYVPPRTSQSYGPRSPSPPPSPPRQQYVPPPPPREPSGPPQFQQSVPLPIPLQEVEGCPAYGKTPTQCKNKKEYLRQSLIFHPDKNINCKEEATAKFQKLNDVCETASGGRRKSKYIKKSKKQQKYNKTKKLKINKKNMKK